MPLYYGNKNYKGLTVSPALQSLKIDLLRAAPCDVGVIARPLTTQPGYASYVTHLPAFLKSYVSRQVEPVDRTGFPVSLPIEKCINLPTPPLVVDYKGPIPSNFVEGLTKIGFERLKINKTDNILRFPTINFDQAREIRRTSPNETTPAPVNAVNLQAFDMWVLSVRLVSNLLLAHTYPAFTDDEHIMDDLDELTVHLGKRVADSTITNTSKRARRDTGGHSTPHEDDDEEMVEPDEDLQLVDTIQLRKAKPPRNDVVGWGAPSELPNTSGLFFSYIPELTSFDTKTVPSLIERYLLQSLGSTPEQQLDRLDRLRSAWGIIGKTDAGNALSHMAKTILLCLTSQTRAFPIIRDRVYQGCVMSGGRFFVGIHGTVYKPIAFNKLSEEVGSHHLHSSSLDRILELAVGEDWSLKPRPKNMRSLRLMILDCNTDESDRDEIRRLAVHLHFENDKFLAVNSQSISKVLEDVSISSDNQSVDLPMHHSALFSRDGVLVALSAFGYQAPSFHIDNCPKISIKESKPPNTLVVRQKTLDLAVVDWKLMLETHEIRNNPRNLSRANRDRSLVGNEKVTVWSALKKLADEETGGVNVGAEREIRNLSIGNDGVEDW